MHAKLLAGVCLLSAITEWAVAQEPRSPISVAKIDYRAGYKAGREEADKELCEGNATIYRMSGFNLFHDHIHRETGLPYRTIASCVVDDEIEGRAAGHNDRIAESIREKGVPSNSFKRWERELFDLKGYFEARANIVAPRSLVAGGPVAVSSDGAFTVRPVTIRSERHEDDTSLFFKEIDHSVDVKQEKVASERPGVVVVSERPGIVVASGGKEHETQTIWHRGETDLLWGPEGSGFAVLRSRDRVGARYSALDLKRGRWLRDEHH